MKTCTKCKMEFPATTKYFHKNNQGKNGLAARCRHCMNEYRRSQYMKLGRKEGNFDKEIINTDFGVGYKRLDIKLKKGKRYIIPKIYRTMHMSESFTGIFEMQTDDLIILRHKRGFCECFRKADILTGEYEIKEV